MLENARTWEMTHLSIYNPIIFCKFSVLQFSRWCYFRDSAGIAPLKVLSVPYSVAHSHTDLRRNTVVVAFWSYCTDLNSSFSCTTALFLHQLYLVIGDRWKSSCVVSLFVWKKHSRIGWKRITDLHHEKLNNFPILFLFINVNFPWICCQSLNILLAHWFIVFDMSVPNIPNVIVVFVWTSQRLLSTLFSIYPILISLAFKEFNLNNKVSY